MVVNTPQLHRAHHSYTTKYVDRNFAGKFPVWDLVVAFSACALGKDGSSSDDARQGAGPSLAKPLD